MAKGVALAGQAAFGGPVVDFDELERGGGRAAAAEHVVLSGQRVAGQLLGRAHRLRQLREQARAVLRQRIHRPGQDQRFERALVDLLGIDAHAEIAEVAERAAALARLHDVVDRAFADALDRAEAIADRLRGGRPIGWIEGVELVSGAVYVGWQDLEAERARLAEQVDHLVRVVHVGRQHRGHELGRIMGLEPGGLVGHQRIGRRMRLVESVAGELLHGVEDRIGHAFVDAVLRRAFAEDGAVAGHLLDLLLAHGPAQQVGTAERIAADDLGHLHDLLLVDHDAVGLAQDRLDALVGVFDGLAAVLAFAIARNQVHRTWSIECAERDQVLEAVRLGVLEHALHAARFELEHGDRLGALEQGVHGLVVERQLADVERSLAGLRTTLVDRLDRPVDDGQRAQAEEVELDQTDLLDIVLVELGDHAVAAGFAVERRVVGQRSRRDDDAAGMLAGVAGQVLELEGEVDEVVHGVVGLVEFPELGDHAVRFLARFFAAAEDVAEAQIERPHRNQLGDAVDLAIRHAEHASAVAQHGLGRHRAEGDDLADMVAPVFRRHVLDHAVALVHAEVDVEVRHRHAFGIEEALEQQAVAERVDVGDAERPGDHRAGTRTASGTDRDVVLLGPVDEVGDDQEVAREAHLDDDVDLGFEPACIVLAREARGRGLPVEAAGQALA